ncbi:hypothetical protein [Lysinibacillus xylanilyticus]|uniref:hypothetical protein n=1 Tax=Lysinibacillus xylanilyticus TaxID=582475 RepID=UPI0036DF3B6F
MSTLNFVDIIVFLAIGIAVLAVLGSLSKSRFVKTVHKDQFRNKKQIGKQNLGKLKEQKTYQQVAKERQLEEAKKLEPKMNPEVTHSLAVVTKDVRERE